MDDFEMNLRRDGIEYKEGARGFTYRRATNGEWLRSANRLERNAAGKVVLVPPSRRGRAQLPEAYGDFVIPASYAT